MLRRMDAARALADLTEISAQVEHAAIVAADGAVLASTLADGERAQRFADGARRLVDEAEQVGGERGLAGVAQLEAATLDGSVFVVRDGERIVIATTRPEPTVGLVFYDLKSCLRDSQPDDRSAAEPARKQAEE
jgi:predicted regulator of Ras-like GTPase activity (Roadblock/LC7/MglB family)